MLKRNKVLIIRLSEKERNKLIYLSKLFKTTVSAWVREAILKHNPEKK